MSNTYTLIGMALMTGGLAIYGLATIDLNPSRTAMMRDYRQKMIGIALCRTIEDTYNLNWRVASFTDHKGQRGFTKRYNALINMMRVRQEKLTNAISA